MLLKNKSVRHGKKRESNEEYEERINTIFKKQGSYSIQYINECVQRYYPDVQSTIQDYFSTLGAVDCGSEQRENLFYQIANRFSDVKDLLSSSYPEGKNLSQDEENVNKIKDLLDAVKALQHFVKPLLGDGTESGKDEKFYGELNQLWIQLDKVTPLYNMVRNFITQKPYSQEKIKLNFQNSTLLAGWDENKECDNSSIILQKDGYYYLGIMHKDFRKLLKHKMPMDGDCYEKMVYKYLPGANKMFRKVFFAKSRRADFNPSNELLEKYEKGTHIKGENFSIEDCHALIDFFKVSINRHEDWKQFDIHFSETSTYRDISDFYKEVDQQGYKISYSKVSVSYINQLVEDGKLFLFKIYNKDFSPLSKGTPNMHTLYWKALFSARNLNDVVYKLNGEAEVFYRKKSLSYAHPTHAANLPIRNKNKLNEKKESVFNYDLIKNRRYTVDKFMLHIPIKMNFKCKDRVDVNMDVKEYIKQSEDFHIIGIDRGERHLLYLVVIDTLN